MTHYGTTNDADLFFLNESLDRGQLWANESDTNKTIALTEATVLIDNLNFVGDKTDAAQELEFPRGGDVDVPTAIEKAAYNIAWHILDGRDIEFEAEHLNDAAASYAGSRLRKDSSFLPEARVHGIPSEKAWRLLRPFLRNGEEITLSRVN